MNYSQSIGLSAFLFGVLLTSCGAENSSTQSTNEATSSKGKDELTCQKLVDKSDEFEGKTITLKAVSWGSSPSIDGKEILMSLDDDAFSGGVQQAHVLAHFTKEQEYEIAEIGENDKVTLTATVGTYDYGALRLLNPKVIK